MTPTLLQRNRPGRPRVDDPLPDDLGAPDPCQRLLLAVIARALRDYLSGSPRLAASARAYLGGPNFTADCGLLGLHADAIRRRLAQKEIDMQQTLPDADVRRIHAEYTGPDTPPLTDLARRHGVSPATLSRAFARLGLPRRGRGHRGPVPQAITLSGPHALDDLRRLLADIDRAHPRTIRLQLEIEL